MNVFLPCTKQMLSWCESYRARSRSLSRTSKRLGEQTIVEKAEHCFCLYDVSTLLYVFRGEVSPPHCTTGQRQRAREQTGAMQCCRAEWPRVRPSSADLVRLTETEFLCLEAFLMGICTCERDGTLVCAMSLVDCEGKPS